MEHNRSDVGASSLKSRRSDGFNRLLTSNQDQQQQQDQRDGRSAVQLFHFSFSGRWFVVHPTNVALPMETRSTCVGLTWPYLRARTVAPQVRTVRGTGGD